MKTTSKGTFALLRYFVGAYPIESLMVLVSLLLAGLAETLGIGALLPLITIIVEGNHTPNNALAELIFHIYSFLGVTPTLLNLLLTIVITITLKATIVFQAMRFVSYVSTDVTRDFRLKLIKALMNARWNYFTGLSIGKISNNISSEAVRAGHCYMLGGRTMAALIQSIIYVIAAFLVSWHVSLVAIILGCLIAFLAKGFIGMARNAGSEMTLHMNNMISQLNESLSGIKPLKAMAQEEHYIEKLDRHTTHVMQAQKKQSLSNLLLQIVYEPMAVICLSAGLYYVLTFTETPVESVLLLAFLFYRMMTHANLLQSFYQNMVQNESAVWEMIKEINIAENEKEIFSTGQLPHFKNEITLNDLTLFYSAEHKILDNFSAFIPKGKITAIFGPSGVGKTSIIDAILGLIKIQSGTIKIDGIALTEIDLKLWRNKIGYVPQETFLFHDTILQNVTLGDKNYSEEDVISALAKADAALFIKNMPKGIHTVVGERGSKLSGGQRQRIAIARALLRQPDLLILDESTSGLDKKTENQILDTLQKITKNVTVIIISHDPQILDIADHVIRLNLKS